MIEKLSFLDSTVNCVDHKGYIHNVVEGGIINKLNELVHTVNTIQKEREAERFEIQEWIDILEAVRESVNIHEKQIDELQMKVNKLTPNINFAQPEVKENVLTKSLRIDKEFAEEEVERLQKENSDLKDKLERITDILYESKYALEEIINPSFISHEQEMAQEALDKVNAEIKAITGENNNE